MNAALLVKRQRALGMSWAALARIVEVDATTMWRWRTGRGMPRSPEVGLRLAAALGVDPDSLFNSRKGGRNR